MPKKFLFSGDRLSHAMQVLGITQDAFATRMGTKQYNISRWVHEDFDPSSPLLRAMADATGLTMEYFMLEEGQPAWPIPDEVMAALNAAKGKGGTVKKYAFSTDRLRQALEETGMRQVDIADQLGLKQANLSRMLNTPDYTPRSSLVAAAAAMTGKAMAWFMVEAPAAVAQD